MKDDGGYTEYRQLDPINGLRDIVYKSPTSWSDGAWDLSATDDKMALLSREPGQEGIHIVDLLHNTAAELPGSSEKFSFSSLGPKSACSLRHGTQADRGLRDLRIGSGRPDAKRLRNPATRMGCSLQRWT